MTTNSAVLALAHQLGESVGSADAKGDFALTCSLALVALLIEKEVITKDEWERAKTAAKEARLEQDRWVAR